MLLCCFLSLAPVSVFVPLFLSPFSFGLFVFPAGELASGILVACSVAVAKRRLRTPQQGASRNGRRSPPQTCRAAKDGQQKRGAAEGPPISCAGLGCWWRSRRVPHLASDLVTSLTGGSPKILQMRIMGPTKGSLIHGNRHVYLRQDRDRVLYLLSWLARISEKDLTSGLLPA